MNINQAVRSVIGEFHLGEAKVLDLKEGQIVKGTVVKLVNAQEAIVNINGIQVRAKLETPLAQGQSTLLQVQPETPVGQMVLKPLDSSSVQIENESMADLIKSIGIKDSLFNRQLIQQMHQQGIALSKENIRGILQLMATMPVDTNTTEWIQSAIIVSQRGLPQTAETISALHQVVFGAPMHQAMNQLNDQLTMHLEANSSTIQEIKEPLTQLQNTIKQIQTLSANYSNNLIPNEILDDAVEVTKNQPLPYLQQGVIQPEEDNSNKTTTLRSAGNQVTTGQVQVPGSNLKSLLTDPTLMHSTATINLSQQTTVPSVNSSSPNKASLMSQGPVSVPAPVSASAPAPALPASIENATQPTASNAQIMTGQGNPQSTVHGTVEGRTQGAVTGNSNTILQNTYASTVINQMNETAMSIEPAPREAPVEHKTQTNTANTQIISGSDTPDQMPTDLISRILKAVGLEHENKIGKANFPLNLVYSDNNSLFDVNIPSGNQDNMMTQRETNQVTDTLKSMLLQLSSSDNLPQSLKDNMQQLLQQVTGQQLLAIPDRTSIFSQITLFLPLNNANGEQTASVHVQSRRGRRGELDTNNCRLLFDLHMKILGETIVDVQIVNRIVALQVHNDHPFITNILESNRKEIASAIEKVGYQFLSMKSSPFPDREESKDMAIPHDILGSAASFYNTKPYKGMDVRV